MKKPSKTLPAIAYTIVGHDLAAHLFHVSVTVAAPAEGGQIFALPAWIPGSYMIREFSRNIVRIRAESKGEPVELTKLDKHSWQAAPLADRSAPLTVHYEVYAWDLSVRAAHLDQNHGFFNGTSVFLRVLGQEEQPHVVDIQRPADEAAADWRVATSLPELKAKRYGFGTYIASNYDELIDHPVEQGDFALATFKAHGIPHDIVITGRVPNLDLARLSADLKKNLRNADHLLRAEVQKSADGPLCVHDHGGGRRLRWPGASRLDRADLRPRRPAEHRVQEQGNQRRLLAISGPVQP